jgi:hypothetical protein
MQPDAIRVKQALTSPKIDRIEKVIAAARLDLVPASRARAGAAGILSGLGCENV